MTLYNTIGHGYARTRAPDHRITERLVALLNLPPAATILDVGAGTGKYARALADQGYSVIALEPSEVMQAQSEPHDGVRFIQAAAERIPLSDDAADGAIVVLTVHHFGDRPAAFREIVRVSGNGPVVLFIFNPAVFECFWLSEYFPAIGRRFRSLPAELSRLADEIRSVTSREVREESFLLPPDLQDRFGAASWSCPEAYLRPEIREGISDFALMDPSELEQGLAHLASDLASGRWDQEHGALRTQESFDAGYRFIIVEAEA